MTGPTGPGASVTPGSPTGSVQINLDGDFGAAQKMFYDYAGSGYLGLNTSSPGSMLHVVGTPATAPVATFKGAAGQTGPLMLFKDSSNTTLFQIDSDHPSNIFIGQTSGDANTPSSPNGINLIALGQNALEANTSGYNSIGIGSGALKSATTGYRNVAAGAGALQTVTTGAKNIGIGNLALGLLVTGESNVAVGDGALYNHTGSFCTGIGLDALGNNTGADNTALGSGAGKQNTTGTGNTGIGKDSLANQTTGSQNTAVGKAALRASGAFSSNTAVGYAALYTNTGDFSVAVGYNALQLATTGGGNTGIGTGSLGALTTGANNTAIGRSSMAAITTNSNCSAVGYQATITADDQVQLGNSSTTTYVYGTVQNRSDLRDKTDVRDTVLGLDFINRLRPVDFRWDMRDDYRPEMPEAPAIDAPDSDQASYAAAMTAWSAASKLSSLVHDGSRKRSRFHHGLIAQEVGALIAESGIDFGGFQNHLLGGGEDVLSIGYDEFIAPLIKAVQELASENASLRSEFGARIEALSTEIASLKAGL